MHSSHKDPPPQTSVIIPVGNAEKFLLDLFKSLSSIEDSSVEFLFVEDGSTVSSSQLLQEACTENPRFRSLSKPQGGVSSARNLGIESAKGEFLLFADADDWLDPSLVSCWIGTLRETNADLVIGNGFSFKNTIPPPSERKPLLQSQPWHETLSGRNWILQGVEKKEWPHYVWIQAMRTKWLRDSGIRFPEGILHEDIVWTTRLALHAEKVAFCQPPLYGYRRNQSSLTRISDADLLQHRAESYLNVFEFLATTAENKRRTDPQLAKALTVQLHRECCHFFGLVSKRLKKHPSQAELARKFLRQKLPREMLAGAVDFSSLWKTLRVWTILQILSRNARY